MGFCVFRFSVGVVCACSGNSNPRFLPHFITLITLIMIGQKPSKPKIYHELTNRYPLLNKRNESDVGLEAFFLTQELDWETYLGIRKGLKAKVLMSLIESTKDEAGERKKRWEEVHVFIELRYRECGCLSSYAQTWQMLSSFISLSLKPLCLVVCSSMYLCVWSLVVQTRHSI